MGWTSIEGSVVDIFERCSKFPRFAAVYPYVISGTRIKVSKYLVVYNLFLAVSLVVFDSYLMITKTHMPDSGNNAIKQFIRSAQLIMTDINIVLSSIWILRNQSKLQEMLDELMQFEDIIQLKNFKVCNRALLAMWVLLMGLIVAHFALSPMEDYLYILIYIRFNLATIMIFANIVFFTRCTRIIGSGYLVVTNQLNHVKTHPSIKDIQKAMEHLVSASEALNIVFGPQMLFITSTSFVLNTGNIYLTISLSSSTLSLVSVIWVVTFTQLMLYIIYTCNWTAERAKELDKAFYRTVLEDKTGELSQQVRMCLHFTTNRKVEFTACGFFTIDFTLAGSMVAAATTYLVILIQIGNSEKSGG